jgi:hypothetical protein
VGEVEHEGRVDDPDPGGEVASALVHESVPAVAGAVAHVAGDAELQRPSLGAGGERVELGVEALGPLRTVLSRGSRWPSPLRSAADFRLRRGTGLRHGDRDAPEHQRLREAIEVRVAV